MCTEGALQCAGIDLGTVFRLFCCVVLPIVLLVVGLLLHRRNSMIGARKVIGKITVAQVMFGGPIILLIIGIGGACLLIAIGVFAPIGGG